MRSVYTLEVRFVCLSIGLEPWHAANSGISPQVHYFGSEMAQNGILEVGSRDLTSRYTEAPPLPARLKFGLIFGTEVNCREVTEIRTGLK